MAAAVFAGGARVQQGHAAVPGQGVQVLQPELPHLAGEQVLDQVARHVHRVLGRSVGRRIGQVQFGQAGAGHPGVDGGGQHVDALVHAVPAHDLRAQQPPAAPLEHHLHGQHAAAGIVPGVVHGREDHGVGVQPCPAGGGLVQAGAGGGQAEHLEHRTALGTAVAAVPAADVVRGDAPLLVGGARQGDQRGLAGDGVAHLHGVAHGVDVGVGSLHAVVDGNAAPQAQFQPGLGGQAAVRRHADGQHHHAGGQRGLALQQHLHAVPGGGKALHRVPQPQGYPVGAHFALDQSGHVGVEGGHQLPGLLHDGHVQPQFPQVLGQLHADETAPRQHGGTGLALLHKTADTQGVLHRAQREHPLQAGPRHGGLSGLGAGGQQQFVVRLPEGLAAVQVAHLHAVGGPVDGGDFVAHLHLHAETLVKTLRRLQGQFGLVLDHAADVVGQPAVGVGDEP